MNTQILPSFFLRFYGRTEEEVKDFLDTLKKDYPLIKRYTIKKQTQSMNLFTPTPKDSNLEATLFFENNVNKELVYNTPDAFERYKSFSVKHQQKNVTHHKRSPEDVAFEVN